VVWTVKKRLKTLVVLGVGTRCDENGEDHVVAPILERLGYSVQRAKTNLGLGRAVIIQKISKESDQASHNSGSMAASGVAS
jgi:hypothetical protein